jgi:hypothetical protein
VRGGLPGDLFFDLWLVDASFTNGFLLLETATVTRASQAETGVAGDAPAGDLARGLAETVSGEAFERGLELIYRGFKETFPTAAGF